MGNRAEHFKRPDPPGPAPEIRAKVIRFPVKEARKEPTLKVKIKGPAGWRVAAGVVLMTVGASIMGVRFEVEK